MRERPILFSGAMVRPILADTKTQTRRIFKPRRNGALWPNRNDLPGMGQILRECPYGQTGDLLWVRETWLPDPPDDGTWCYTAWAGCKGSTLADIPERFRTPEHCLYRASWSGGGLTWTPSIHMPLWASRILLEITGVRVERLQEISEADAVAEGIQYDPGEGGAFYVEGLSGCASDSAADSYRKLWESINGPESWASNPWVWVIDFKRLGAGDA